MIDLSGCNLRFSVQNYIETATITATPTAVTDLDFLKNALSSRRAKWNGLGLVGEIVIDAVLDQQRMCDFWAIPGHNLPTGALIKADFFTNAADTIPVISTGYRDVGDYGLIIPPGFTDPFAEFVDPLNDTVYHFFDKQTPIERLQVTINHPYDYVPTTTNVTNPPVVTTTSVSDGIFLQDGAGLLSIEAESGDVIPAGNDTLNVVADGAASGGNYLEKTYVPVNYNPYDGPRIKYTFTSSQSGAHDIWVRLITGPFIPSEPSGSDKDSFYVLFNDQPSFWSTHQYGTTNWEWYKAHTVNITADIQNVLTIALREERFLFDKLVIQPAGSAAPTGTGPAESGFGSKTVTTVTEGGTTTVITADLTDSVQLRHMMLGNTVTLENSLAFGGEISFFTDPEIAYTEDGKAIATRPQYPAKSFNLPLNQMSESDRLNIWRLEALRKPLLITAYPGADAKWYSDNYVFLGRFKVPLRYKDRDWKLHATGLPFVEV